VDGLRFGVLHGQLEGNLRELKRRTVRRGECEMPARLRLYKTQSAGPQTLPPGTNENVF